MSQIFDIVTWRDKFGLFPINLHSTIDEENFLVQNGGRSDFCLSIINQEKQKEEYFSHSWSSNSKLYLEQHGENIKIYNWNKTSFDTIKTISLENNFDKFYGYIKNNSFSTSNDVVPFLMSLFRQLRNLTLEDREPVYALNLFFVLLASLETPNTTFRREEWAIQDFKKPHYFDELISKLKTGLNGITPNLKLILRHVSSQLFQEAHKEVLFFDLQRDLFEGTSTKIKTGHVLYSSIHYTPSHITRIIVEETLRNFDLASMTSIKIFDPACGSSEFLIEILKQLKYKKYTGTVELIAWDSSQIAINTSKFILNYEKRNNWQEQLTFEAKLVEDSLKETWDNDYDIILMNPPFISWEILTSNSREVVKECLSPVFQGKPNQASAFFYKSFSHLKNTGILGCLIPSTILSLDSYSKLRNQIYEESNIKFIAKLGNYIFEDALTDVSLMIVKKSPKQNVPTLLWTKNEQGNATEAIRNYRKMIYTNQQYVDKKGFSIFKPAIFPLINNSWKTISYSNYSRYQLIERHIVEKKLYRLKDIFNVQQGIRTGANKIFKISKEEYEKIPKLEKKYFKKVIENKSIKSGSIKTENFVWYPYDKKGEIFKDESTFLENAPYSHELLLKDKDALLKRARINENSWWQLSEHRAWLRKSEKRLISSEFGNSSSFAIDLNGDFAIERGNGWIPKKEFSSNDYYFYLALFSSKEFDELLRVYSKELAGGKWYNLGKLYTGQIPIPNVHSNEIRNTNTYNKLVNFGIELSNDNQYVKPFISEQLEIYY